MENNMDDEIDKIVNNFDKVDQSYYSKEQVVKFKQFSPKINFENCHVAISKNGGLIAFVKRHRVFIMESNNPIKEHIRVFNQDGTNEQRIRFPFDKDDQYVVYFDFTDEEVLYAIMSDGGVFKIDIFTSRVIQKTTGNTFKSDNIVSARYFMKGFVALTAKGNFYIVKSFKELSPVLFFEMKKLLDIDYVPTYQFIPPTKNSNKIELFIPVYKLYKEQSELNQMITEKRYVGHGVIKIEEQEKFEKKEINGINRINGVYYIKKNKLENWGDNSGLEPLESGIIPQITCIAASPAFKQIAFYSKNGLTYVFDLPFDNEVPPPKIIKFAPSPKFKDDKDKEEQMAVIDFHEANNCQLIFSGEDAVVLAGKRYLFLAPIEGGMQVYKMTNRSMGSSLLSAQFMKCLSEVDGTRILMHDSVHFISKVSQDLYDCCYPFSDEPSKKLINAFNSAERKDANCDKMMREIQDDLPKAITSLQNAATALWKKDVQMYILKAAQHGKNFVQKDEFNFDSFVEICKDIRIINNLRESNQPRLITYKQYKSLYQFSPKELIKRVLQTQDFYMAYNISKFLDSNIKKVYQKYAIAQIKHLSDALTDKEEIDAFDRINKKLSGISNISYIKLAKKAFKYNKQILGMKFLDKEQSILTKIPQYIELKQWGKAIELAFKTFDSNVVTTVLDKMFRIENLDDAFFILKRFKQSDSIVLEYLRKNIPNELPNYLKTKGNYEDLFFFYIEEFFKSQTFDTRKECLNNAKDALSKIEGNKESTFDVKFHKLYLSDLNNSLILKRDLLKDDVIKQTDTGEFDSSTYDVFRTALKASKVDFVDSRNKHFELSNKKFNILKIRVNAETKNIEKVAKLFYSDYKKTGLSPINFAEVFLENGDKDKAAEAMEKLIDPDYFDYKVEILKQIEKYESAIKVILSDKDCEEERKYSLTREILNKKPELTDKARELCNIYKVDLKL